MKNVITTLNNAEKISGVHYTIKHTGKMEGMASLSTSCTCNSFCKNRSCNKSLICSHCYAERQMKMYHNLEKCLIKNTEILTSKILDKSELPIINFLYFRFESFGDLININQVINYFNICRKNPKVHFALWTKNPFIIADTIREGHVKPRNLQIIYSSPRINIVNEPKYDFIDKIFTVYDKKYIKENDININCGAEKCITCGKCYNKSKVRYINEMIK